MTKSFLFIDETVGQMRKFPPWTECFWVLHPQSTVGFQNASDDPPVSPLGGASMVVCTEFTDLHFNVVSIHFLPDGNQGNLISQLNEKKCNFSFKWNFLANSEGA